MAEQTCDTQTCETPKDEDTQTCSTTQPESKSCGCDS